MANPDKKDRSTFEAALFGLTLARGAGPLHLQLTEALRALILRGGAAGRRLPSSRALAGELSVSRLTVTTAYDQLIAEGYLQTRPGAGTFVAGDLPHLAPPPPGVPPLTRHTAPVLPFLPGLPDQRLFPHRLWARHLERAWRAPEAGLLDRADPFGWYPLRASIADHLGVWRGLACTPEQVVITSGARDVTEILCHALLPPGAAVATEDPGWPVQQALLGDLGARPLPLRIGAEGLDPATIPQGTQAVIVTPSRQYPTGVAMALPQRLALLGWARATGGLIVEDDYDGEFRYRGQPLPSLAGLDGLRATLYSGSFSKLLSPGLRIGYLVVPEALAGRVRRYLARGGLRVSLLPQPALAAFMASGEFATHLRRMRRVYAARQAVLIDALQPVAGLLELRPDASGMHLVAPLAAALRARSSDAEIVLRGADRGLTLKALSAHAQLPAPPQGLVLGYTAFDEAQIRAAAARLCDLLREIAA
ncbi:MocR-like pyridoxine biosynthesis transcription factor PdxR [Rhodobacter capsulatus]|uniref:MocR-like pyridoxine biosynthesis transcription factor PdxR n=1 Tax=Rhodobacter capsulatus TaxID=1061 RepID=UPI0003D29E5E|nr:PLP-dependent aminotransferase family protein [Rhodobacter capsulatus]ETD90606.1 GntR family transcriptional regulator [Rhodobacter capsulatus YW2]